MHALFKPIEQGNLTNSWDEWKPNPNQVGLGDVFTQQIKCLGMEEGGEMRTIRDKVFPSKQSYEGQL